MSPVAGPVPTYVARFPGPFGALVQAPTLGGLRLEPLPAVRVRDVFWDTPSADLLDAGWVLRVRHREAPDGDGVGGRDAALRSLAGDRPPVPLPGDPADGLTDNLGPALDGVLGRRPDRLLPLFEIRQFRTPRVVYDADRPVAVLSLDVVVADTGRPAGRVSHEARLRLTSHGGPADLIRLDPALREHGLVPSTRSTVERAIQRIVPLRLLPDEREAVAQRAASGDPDLAIRAAAVARVARGAAPADVAAALGVSLDEVEVWAEAVADHRLAALAPLPPARKSYHVSAIVGDGGPGIGAPPASSATPADGPADGPGGTRRSVTVEAPLTVPDVPLLAPAPTPRLLPPVAPRLRVAGDAALDLDAPLTSAAAHSLARALDRVRDAADAITSTPSARTALGLRAAAADARLSLAAFSLPDGAAVLPDAPVDRLSVALAFVGDRLLDALDADRASWRRTSREHALLASRDAALSDVLAHLRSPAWLQALALGERLVGRLRAQAADGVGAPDDGPPSDAAPSALRHVAAGVLWRRLETVRALEARITESPGDVATAVALVVALDAVRHLVGLVAWPDRRLARDLVERFADASAEVAEARDGAVATQLAASVEPGGSLGPVVRATWQAALAPDPVAALAALAASAVEVP